VTNFLLRPGLPQPQAKYRPPFFPFSFESESTCRSLCLSQRSLRLPEDSGTSLFFFNRPTLNVFQSAVRLSVPDTWSTYVGPPPAPLVPRQFQLFHKSVPPWSPSDVKSVVKQAVVPRFSQFAMFTRTVFFSYIGP